MVLPLLLLSLFQAPQALGQPNPAKNSFLIYACQATVRLQEAHAPAPNDEATRLEIACVTYIQGFADSAALTQGLCVKGVSIGTLTKEYLAYMKQHPELLDQNKALGLAASIRESHPCSAR
jgi:Rap1a immunity proteins